MATILVVDDEQPLRELLVAVFESGGHRTIMARDGRQALEVITSQRPDLVLSDVMMPLMDGAELCRRVKAAAATRDLPVVLMSAIGGSRAAAAGADAFVAKPFDLDEMEQLVLGLLPREVVGG
jgi:CheY-like chemotaxis protein